MINLYEESINELSVVFYDKSMLDEKIFAYKEQSGQYFCATYYHSLNDFKDFSTTGDFKLGDIIKYFKNSSQYDIIKKVIKLYKKRKFFRNSNKIRFYFKFNGNSLSLVDVWTEKESYILPKDFNDMFCIPSYVDSSELIFNDILSNDFIKSNPGVLIRRKNGLKIRI